MANTKDRPRQELTDEEILYKLEGYKLVDDCCGFNDLERHEWVKFINKKTGKFCNGGLILKNQCPDHLLIRIPTKGGGNICKIKLETCYIYINENRHLQVKTDIADDELKEELFRAYNEGRLIEARTKTEAKEIKTMFKTHKLKHTN